MANNIIFMDGAELNSTELWTTVSGITVAATPVSPMSGDYYFQIGTGAGNSLEKDLGANKTELWFMMKWQPRNATAIAWAAYDSAGTLIFTLIRNSVSGLMEARRGAYNGTLLATGSQVLALNTTYLVEIHYKPLNSGGVFQLKIDGVLDIDYSDDTTNGLENIRKFRIGSQYPYSNGAAYVDDIIVDDGDWIGNLKIAAIIKPNGAGTTTEWDPSAGANYECVDEIPPSDADYNSTNTADEIDLFACNDIVGAITAIRGIQVNARMAYEGAPTPTHVQIGLRTGGSNFFSADKSPGASFGQQVEIWMNNPDTTDPWAESEINALEIGYKAMA